MKLIPKQQQNNTKQNKTEQNRTEQNKKKTSECFPAYGPRLYISGLKKWM